MIVWYVAFFFGSDITLVCVRIQIVLYLLGLKVLSDVYNPRVDVSGVPGSEVNSRRRCSNSNEFRFLCCLYMCSLRFYCVANVCFFVVLWGNWITWICCAVLSGIVTSGCVVSLGRVIMGIWVKVKEDGRDQLWG